MTGNTLTMNIVAHDHASKVFSEVGKAAEHGGKKIKEFGEKNSEALKFAGAAAGAAGAALLVKGFSDVLDQDASAAKFGAKLGVSKEESARLGKLSGELYAENYGESSLQINDTLSQIMQSATLSTTKNVKDVTARVLTITQSFGTDTQAVINATGQLLANGLAVDAAQATDIITAGFQSGIDKSGDFLDSLNEYGNQFAKLGLSGAEATALLSQGIKNGARDADTVSDTLKEFSIRAIDNSKTTLQGFKDIGLNGKKMGAEIAQGGDKAKAGLALVLDKLRAIKDPVKQNAAAVALFGTKAEDMGKALLGLDLKKASSGLKEVAGATTKMSDAMGDTASAQFETFKRGLEMKVSGGLRNAMTDMKGVLDLVTTVAGFIADNLPLFITLGALLGGIVGTIKTVIFVTELWAAAQVILDMAFAPMILTIGGVVLVVAALVAGVIYAYKHFKGFRDVCDAVGRAAVVAFKALWNWSKTAFFWIKDNWKKIGLILIGPVGQSIIWIVNNWGKIRKVFTDFFSWSGKQWTNFYVGVYKAFSNIASKALGVYNLLKRAGSLFTSGLSTMFSSSVGNVVKSVLRIKDTFWSVINAIRSMWNKSIGGFNFSAPSWVPGIGGQGIHIPFLAEGGIATRPTLALIGEGGEPEMVLPLSKARQQGFGSTGMTVNIHVTQPLGSPEAIARAVSTALRSSSVRGSTFALGRA